MSVGGLSGDLYGAAALVAAFASMLTTIRGRRTHRTINETKELAIETRDLSIATADQVTPSNGHTTAELVEALAGAYVVHANDGHGGDAYPPKIREVLGIPKRTLPAKKQSGRRR